ncbi:MAG TPA: FtsX-like permease family protein, partial [Blastocatellia bacterium]|nr:FtsX-like permease family protein [Blastocatellia bacterium]
IVDLNRAWVRSIFAMAGLALAILAVAVFAYQISLRQAEVRAEYEKGGAASFIAEISGVPDGDIDALVTAARAISGVNSVEAPYNGVDLALGGDISFVVFQNDRQREYLGARTSVIGVDRSFDLERDYYVNFHRLNPQAPQSVLGIPLIPASGTVRAPASQETLVPSSVTDYVGVRPGAQANIELRYTRVTPPIVRRFEGVQLIGTFDVAGPDQGRFDPFWQLELQGQEVLTVHRPDVTEKVSTTLPVVLSADVVRNFLTSVRSELEARAGPPAQLPSRDQLVIRANTIDDVPAVEMAVRSLLKERPLAEDCDGSPQGSFCLRLPERNNFQAAFQEQSKVGAGASFFIGLLIALIAVGTAGLQVQTVVMRWRELGVLQAIGFSPGQIVSYYGLQLCLLLTGGIVFATIASVALTPALGSSLASIGLAAAVSVVVGGLAALPVLLWPLCRSPADLIGDQA